jgi:drug/metabolite transporter (DMT)-like permease
MPPSTDTTNATRTIRQLTDRGWAWIGAGRQNTAVQPDRTRGDATLAVAINLLIVYVLWGSTYLAIRIVVGTLPPFLAAAARFLVAGVLLIGFVLAYARMRPSAEPMERLTWRHWRSALIIGALLLFAGNGLVSQAEQHVDSGIAAVLIAAVPIWMNVIDAIVTRRRPSLLLVGGVLAGFVGILVLLAPMNGVASINALGVGLLVLASLSWAAGSIYSRHAPLPRSGLLFTGMEQLAGGVVLVIASLLVGEPGRLDWSQVSTASLLGVAYLIVFGSLVAFTAYTWLLAHAPVSTVATYAYVNPVVAVALGALVLHEPITLRTILASVLILGAVVAMVSGRPRDADEAAQSPAPEPMPEAEPEPKARGAIGQ